MLYKFTTKYTPRCENLLHRKYGNLTAIGFAGYLKGGKARWLWKCDCGKYTLTGGSGVKYGHTKTCGCSWLVAHYRHGQNTRAHRTPEYTSWYGMNQRCHGDHAEPGYIKRGITVCDRWRSGGVDSNPFVNFFADMGPRPNGNYSIDRRDNNKGYSPENCYWATTQEQASNTSKTIRITFEGRTMCLSEWARAMGISRGAMVYRLRKWPLGQALTAYGSPPR